jgi:hypothetical protein
MSVEIVGFDKGKREDIEAAAAEEWEFDDFSYTDSSTDVPSSLSSVGQESLCGGETEDQFARRLAKAVFKANGKPCKVIVRATCLENLPCKTHSFDENNADLMA